MMATVKNEPQESSLGKRQSTSPTLSTILNNNNHHDTPMKEYLPTPVTPASDFPHYHLKKDTTNNNNNNNNTTSSTTTNTNNNASGAYSTFSVIKPPTTPTTRNNANASGTDTKPYPCPECHQTFSRPHNLKSHLTTHSSERPFQCDVCNHHFRRHHDLKRHQKLHTGERPYVCKDCYRSFARLDALNRHRRAEGGTACSAVHQQVKQDVEKSSANATYNKNNTPSSSSSSTSSSSSSGVVSPTTTSARPVIPQLHIPHPASHLYPKDYQPTTSLPIPPTHSPPKQQQQQQQLLPSPSALSTLPIANNNNLTPIYQPKSLPTTPSSPPSIAHHKTPLYHPYQPWSPYRSVHNNTSPSPNGAGRPTLPPLSASPPSAFQQPQELSKLDQLKQENEELKRDINKLRAMAQKEAASLKSRVHDLEVENKVLRSLIHNPASHSSGMDSRTRANSQSSSVDSHHASP